MRYIVFEGIDGCGKSTVAKAVQAWIAKPSLLISFPSRRPVGRLLRQALDGIITIDPKSLLWLYVADQVECEPNVEAALAADQLVFATRHVLYSSPVYQSRYHDLYTVREVLRQHPFRRPDLAVLIDVPVGVALARMSNRVKRVDAVFERGVQPWEERRNMYLRQADETNMLVVDGTLPLEEIVNVIAERIGVV